MNTYLLGSREFQSIIVSKTVNGALFPVTSGVEYVIVPKGQPYSNGVWKPCVTLDGEIGFYTDDIVSQGYYTVGVRLTNNTEAPVARAGFIRIK
jgi:hypothetical protein